MQSNEPHREPLNTSSSVLFNTIPSPQLLVNREPETLPEPLIIKEVKEKPRILQQMILLILVISVVGSGAINRVAGKVVTVPMNEYSFFLAMFNAVIYVVFYFLILLIRYCLNIVPGRQFSNVWKNSRDTSLNPISRIGPWKYFLLTGLLDGLGTILQVVATPYLPGPIISLLGQSSTLFSMIISFLILGTKYSFWEVWSFLLLTFGVTLTLIPEFTGIDQPLSLYYSLIMGFVALPQAISVTVKEYLFRIHDFDLFIVNSHGSLFQLITFPIFLPLAIVFNQTQGQSLKDYIINGFSCFGGKTPPGSEFNCSPDPYPYLIYIGINIVWNLLTLLLVKRASAVLSFMTVQAILPVSVILFYINWPYLSAQQFSFWTILGLVVIMGALGIYQFFSLEKKKIPDPCFSFSLPCVEKACKLNSIVYSPVKEIKEDDRD